MNYHETPVHELRHPTIDRAGLRLLVKREDLNHPTVSGNKWWKLKYNLLEATRESHSTLLTFGGAFSNHLYATAAAAAESDFKSIGIVRGEETLPLNSTLAFAREKGMRLHYIGRTEYRDKNKTEFIGRLHDLFGDFFLIPEGGSNRFAVRGCAEFAVRELSKVDFDHLILPVGTGGTISGLVCGLQDQKNIIGISVLKDGAFLSEDIQKMVFEFSGYSFARWSIHTGYHHGGYAKTTEQLLTFIDGIQARYDLPLDPVYTGKAFWALLKEVEAGSFRRGETVLFLHTGGHQGKRIKKVS